MAISADGTTVIGGAPRDNEAGAAWALSAPPFHRLGAGGRPAPRPQLKPVAQRPWPPKPGAIAANVQPEFFGTGGNEASATYVPPLAQWILNDLVWRLGVSDQGALEIRADQALKVTSRTYNQVSPNASYYPDGTQGQGYPTLAVDEGLIEGQSAYLSGLIGNGSNRANIRLANTGPDAAVVTVEVYDGAGTKLTDYTVSLAPGQWAQETQPFRNKAGHTAMDRGCAKVTVTSGMGVVAFASVVDNITNDPTTITMQR